MRYQNKQFYYFSKSAQKFVEIRNFYRKIVFLITFFALLISFFVFGTFLVFNDFLNPYKYSFSRSTINNNIMKAINNNADLKIIKQIYTDREIISGPLHWFEKKNELYSNDVPLSTILENIRYGIFLNSQKPDSSFLIKLSMIIDEHSQTNPFDKLNGYQKESFQNVRQKLGDKFSIISHDMVKISDEIYNKNLLLDEYLFKSNISFWISILALIITIILSSYQLYNSRISQKELMELIRLSEIQTPNQQLKTDRDEVAVD